ncbi:MAG: GspH/FimT family pseudopilin [Desulfobacterota bacterium]|nr:GspH/FimT family pseudopilin [Thermodesulfobacteriota bacterium]
MRKCHQGFSLVELMVVCAIICILAGAAVPTIVSALPGYRLQRAARQLCTHLRQARSHAIKNNQKIWVRFDTAGRQYTVDTVGTFKLPAGISFGHGKAKKPVGTKFPANGISFRGNKVAFNPRGIISSNSGYVYLQNDELDTCAVGATTAGNIVLRCWHGAWR